MRLASSVETMLGTARPADLQALPADVGATRFAELLAARDEPSQQDVAPGKEGRAQDDPCPCQEDEDSTARLAGDALPGPAAPVAATADPGLGPAASPVAVTVAAPIAPMVAAPVAVTVPAPVAPMVAAPVAVTVPAPVAPMVAAPAEAPTVSIAVSGIGLPSVDGMRPGGAPAAEARPEGSTTPPPLSAGPEAPAFPARRPRVLAAVALSPAEPRPLPEAQAASQSRREARETPAGAEALAAPGFRPSGVARPLTARPASGGPASGAFRPDTPPSGSASAGESARVDAAALGGTAPLSPLPTPSTSISAMFQPQQGPFRSESSPAAPETAAQPLPAPSPAEEPVAPQQVAGPVQEVRLAPGQGDGLAVLLAVATAQDLAEVEAEAPVLMADLNGIGAKVEAVRVEVAPRSPQEGMAGWASGQHPGSGPWAGQPGQEEALARHAKGSALGDRAHRERALGNLATAAARMSDHGGKVDRYA